MLSEIFEYSSNIIVRKIAKIIEIFNLPKYLTFLLIPDSHREGCYRLRYLQHYKLYIMTVYLITHVGLRDYESKDYQVR